MKASPSAYGVTISFGRTSKLYPYSILSSKPVINDTFSDQPYVVVFDPSDTVALTYLRSVNGQTYTFTPYSEDSTDKLLMKDEQTGSVWNRMTGKCIRGTLEGKTLQQEVSVPWLIDRWEDIYGKHGTKYSE